LTQLSARKRDDIIFLICLIAIASAVLFSFGAGEKYQYPADGKPGVFKIKNLRIDDELGTRTRVVTESSLPLLRGGEISTGAGSTLYSQYLKFNDTSDSAIGGGKIVYEENEDGTVDGYLRFKKGRDMFEYELNFEEGLSSDISGTTLRNIEGEKLSILGEEFEIVEAVKSGNKIELKLYGGSVLDTLPEMQAKEFYIEGKKYTITPIVIGARGSADVVKFVVNGEVTKTLQEGDAYVLVDGTQLGVKEIVPNEAKETSGGQDTAQFYLGSKILGLTDDDFSDDDYNTGGLKIRGDTIHDGRIRIKADEKDSGDTLVIQTIEYRVKANGKDNGDIYIPSKGNLRRQMKNPEALIADSWNIYYGGLSETRFSDIDFEPRGDNAYRLAFENNREEKYRIKLVDCSTGAFRYGDEDNDFIFMEAQSESAPNIQLNDYFLLNDREDDKSISHIYRYESFDSSNSQIVLEDMSEEGDTRTLTYSNSTAAGVLGRAVLSLDGTSYNIYINSTGAIAVDQNGDGAVSGGKAKIAVSGGGLLDLGSNDTITGDSINITLTTFARNLYDRTADEIISFNITRSGSELDLTVPEQAELSLDNEGDNYKGRTVYGVLFDLKDTTKANTLNIDYPIVQGSAEVAIAGE